MPSGLHTAILFQGPTTYVVLVGDVGTGKSTIVEKLTGEKDMSSSAEQSVTTSAAYLPVPGYNLLICDTPGSNAMTDNFKHNIWIAQAMSFHPISKLLITVKADVRIDNVVRKVREYEEQFEELGEGVMGVIVTHMDKVSWTPDKCSEHLKKHLDITDVIFTNTSSSKDEIVSDISDICHKPALNLTVNEDNFQRLFKIKSNDQAVLRSIKKEVASFKDMMGKFHEERSNVATQENDTDLVKEFLAWMKRKVRQSEQKVAEENKFTFIGENSANERGHIVSLKNQLLKEVDVLQGEIVPVSVVGRSTSRKCKSCGLKRVTITGLKNSDKHISCGCDPLLLKVKDSEICVVSRFMFEWSGQKLRVIENSDETNNTGGQFAVAQLLDQIWNSMERGAIDMDVDVFVDFTPIEARRKVPITIPNWSRTFREALAETKTQVSSIYQEVSIQDTPELKDEDNQEDEEQSKNLVIEAKGPISSRTFKDASRNTRYDQEKDTQSDKIRKEDQRKSTSKRRNQSDKTWSEILIGSDHCKKRDHRHSKKSSSHVMDEGTNQFRQHSIMHDMEASLDHQSAGNTPHPLFKPQQYGTKANEKKAATKKDATATATGQRAVTEMAAVEKAAVERAATKKAAAERAASKRAAAERAAAEKVAAEKVAAEMVAAETAAAEKAAAERAASKRAVAERAALEKAAAESAAAERAAAERAAAAAEEAAVGKAAAEKVAAEKVSVEKVAAERAASKRAVAEDTAQFRQDTIQPALGASIVNQAPSSTLPPLFKPHQYGVQANKESYHPKQTNPTDHLITPEKEKHFNISEPSLNSRKACSGNRNENQMIKKKFYVTCLQI